jgi:hypothetical protein
VLLARLDVVPHGVAMGEGTALRILTGEAHGDVLHQQTAESEHLGAAPVDGALAGSHLAPRLVDALHGAMHVEALGHARRQFADALEGRRVDTGVGVPHLAGPRHALPDAAEGVGPRLHLEALGLLLAAFEDAVHVGTHAVDLVACDDAGVDQLLTVEGRHRRVVLDLGIHQGLRQRRIVGLVVPPAAVALQVDQHVPLELLAEGDGQPCGMHHLLRVVGVDVEHRRLDLPGDVGRILREASLLRCRRVAELVVDDDVDRTAVPVALQLRQVQRLGDSPLPGEGGLAVDLHRHDARAGLVVQVVLLGQHHALDHRIHQFEVTRVRAQRQVHLAALAGHEVVRVALVILDVALVLGALLPRCSLEVGEHHLVRLVQDVGEDVQPAAVGHADDHLLDAETAALLDEGVDQGKQRLSAFDGEALLADVAGVQELLELLGLDQLEEETPLFVAGVALAAEDRLDALLDPRFLLLVGRRHRVRAEGAAVGAAQAVEQPLQRPVGLAAEGAEADALLEVLVGEAELGELEKRMARDVVAEGIELCQVVAPVAVGTHEGDDALVGALTLATLVALRGDVLGLAGLVLLVAAAEADVEAAEEGDPFGVERGGIGQILLVELVDVVGVGAADIGRTHDSLIAGNYR